MPLSTRIGVKIEQTVGLAEGNGTQAVDLVRDLIDDAREDVVVVCTHGDVLSKVLAAIADEYRMDFGSTTLMAKGSMWHLRLKRDRSTVSYLPPTVEPGR
jgi:hypothetical protein